MGNRFTYGKTIIAEPFPETSVKTEIKSGVAFFTQKTKLVSLKVLIGNLDGSIPANSLVYVPADLFNAHWAKKVYHNVNGLEFIVVPDENIVYVEVSC